jgi:hypothetical protein
VANLHAGMTDTGQPAAGCTGTRSPSPGLSDGEVLSRARSNGTTGSRFTALSDRGEVPYTNPQTGLPDHSRAHFELMQMLAFWTARNAGQMERLFGASAHGRHPEWIGRPDYMRRTVKAAVTATKKVFRRGTRPRPDAAALAKLDELDEAACAAKWPGGNGPRNRYALDALIRTAEQQGQDHPTGVTVRASLRYLSLKAGMSCPRTLQAAIKDLEGEGWLSVVSRGRDVETANVYLLKCPARFDHSYEPPVYIPDIKTRGLLRCIRDNGKGQLAREIKSTNRDGDRIVSHVVHTEPRSATVSGSIGKAGALCIEKILLAGGKVDVRELAATMNPQRARDYIRRVVGPVAAAGLLHLDGDEASVPHDIGGRLHVHLRDTGALRAEHNQLEGIKAAGNKARVPPSKETAA